MKPLVNTDKIKENLCLSVFICGFILSFILFSYLFLFFQHFFRNRIVGAFIIPTDGGNPPAFAVVVKLDAVHAAPFFLAANVNY